MRDFRTTILCVDDEANVLSALRRVLRRENYRVLTAGGGEEALALLEKEDVRLVMSDQRMPGMNGTELMAKVKERHPDVIRVILSGYTDVDSIMESVNQGHVFKFFFKPWSDEDLRRELREALAQRDSGREREGGRWRDGEGGSARPGAAAHDVIDISVDAAGLPEAVLDELPSLIVSVGLDGRILLANRRARALLPGGGELVSGRGVPRAWPGAVMEAVRQSVTEGGSRILPEVGLEGRAYRVAVIPLTDPYGHLGAVLVFTPAGKKAG
jgi:CheY-like chemotaxis protein